MSPYLKQRNTSLGFTLVELMVAMVLGLLVVGGAMLVYMSSSATYRAQESTAQMIENGRTAVEMISRDLRMAEYWKCIGWQAANLSNHLPSNQRGIYGIEGVSGAPDRIRTLQAMDDTGVDVTADFELTTLDTSVIPEPTLTPNPIPVDSVTGFATGDIIVINDCAKGDVLTITGVSGSTLTHNCTTCVEVYATGAQVLRVEDVQYLIANNARSQPTLFRIVSGGMPEELLEGVEDMQIMYGEDTDSDGIANRYVNANVIHAPCAAGTNPGCWQRVPSVRISLLLRTFNDAVTVEAQTYPFNGSNVTSTDGRLRRPFTAVVALRNHFNN